MHQSGHWLGLDVHDKGSYKLNQTPRAASASHGLNRRARACIFLRIVLKLKRVGEGLGFALKMIFSSAKGHQNLSHALPVSIADIEALIKEGLKSRQQRCPPMALPSASCPSLKSIDAACALYKNQGLRLRRAG